MGVVVVRAQVYSSSVGLADTVANLARRIEKRGGFQNVAESVGSSFGLIPSWGNVTFRVYGVTEADREKAEKAVRAETGLSTFGASAWRNVASEFVADVAVKSVSDTVQLGKDVGTAVKDGAKGIGFGIGFGLILLGAGYLLVLRGGRV